MIGLIGKKIGMTQVFTNDGAQQPVTLIEVGPCYVTDIRNNDKHGYVAVQMGFGKAKEKRVTKAHAGQFKKSKTPLSKILREIRTTEVEGLAVGSQLNADNFEVGDFVDVQGVSIGRGFQGVVKRHHFKGGESAHGSKMGRESGSIGQGNADPSRVPKGRRMAGHMGDENISVRNLKVLKVDADKGYIAVSGSVPGVEGGVLMIKTALSKGKPRKWKVVAGKAEKAASSEKTQKENSESNSSAGSEEPKS